MYACFFDLEFRKNVDDVVQCAVDIKSCNPRTKWCYCIRDAAIEVFRKSLLSDSDLDYLRFAHRSGDSQAMLTPEKLRTVSLFMIEKEKPTYILKDDVGVNVGIAKPLLLAGEVLEEVFRVLIPSSFPLVQPIPAFLDSKASYPINTWGYCAYCWRIVLVCDKTAKRYTRCDLHQPATEGEESKYDKIRRMLLKRKKQIVSEDGDWVDLLSWPHRPMGVPLELLPTLAFFNANKPKNIDFSPRKENVGFTWHEGGTFPPKDFVVTPRRHNLDMVWELYPLVKSHIISQGGDVTDEFSILSSLQGNLAGGDKKIYPLVRMMAQDFGLASFWLKNAEVWLIFLRDYEKKHGGARQGAGRPINNSTCDKCSNIAPLGSGEHDDS